MDESVGINEEGSRRDSTPQDELEKFRADWKKELGEGGTVQEEKDRQDSILAEEDIHTKARELFLEGVRQEENGKLYEAISFYKKAVNLVPDIEKEAFTFTTRKQADHNSSRKPGEVVTTEKEQEEEEEEDFTNLLDSFSRIRLDNSPLIQKELPSQEKHIGELPFEVLNYILKWVVSSDLDFRSLEACSQVCRGFYIAARDNEIWRLICGRVFGTSILTNKQQIYRDVFLTRPRLQFSGCYISKMTYIREGERGFQHHETYRAWHIVQYFRFIRFFPGGRMLMIISSEDPGLTVKLMNNRNYCAIQGSMFGEYRIADGIIICVLHKPKAKKPKPKFSNRKKRRDDAGTYYEAPDQDYLLELMVKGKKALHWKSYKIVNRYSNGQETVDSVSLSDNNYPRMLFSRVGSYHFESNSPLQ